jgi:hypothetical protein
MDGTNTYDVCIVFNVKASDDDEALNKVTSTLAHDTRYDWAWIYTTNTRERENNDTKHDNQ